MAQEMLNVGGQAPDFELQGQSGKVKLSDLRGQKVILAFHPGAFTNICSAQMLDLELHKKELDGEGAKAVTISADPPAAKAAWAKTIGAEETPLLADFWPHGEVARKYGVFDEEGGYAKRAAFIIDEEGKIAWKKVYPMSQVPDVDEIVEALKQI